MASGAVETLQLFISIVGACFAIIALVNARRDAHGLTDRGEQIVALGNVEREVALLVAQSLLILVGLVSVSLPADASWMPVRIGVVRAALVVVSIVLMALSAGALKRRRQQVAYLLGEERERRRVANVK